MSDLLDLAQGKRMTEHQIQSAFFVRLLLSPWKHYPIFAVPNFAGFHGSEGARQSSGARAKREGRRKGVPDIVVAMPRGNYGALYLETKTSTGAVNADQREWLLSLRQHGNAVAVGRTPDELWEITRRYLEGQWEEAHQWKPGRWTPPAPLPR